MQASSNGPLLVFNNEDSRTSEWKRTGGNAAVAPSTGQVMDLELAIFDFYAVPTSDAEQALASYPQALIVAGLPAQLARHLLDNEYHDAS